MKQNHPSLSFVKGTILTILLATIGSLNTAKAQCPDTLFVPRGMSICEGTTITFEVNPDLPITEGTLLWSTGETGTSITVTPTQSGYIGLSLDKGTSICTDSVFITVIARPDSITSTTNVICNPFTINLKSMPGTAHQWYRYNFAISGATGQIYTASTGGNYWCETTNICGTFNSNIIPVTKYYPPTLNVSLSGSSIICSGDSVAISSVTNAALPTYQWSRNNVAIPGATNPDLQAKQAGNYKLVVTDNTTTCSRNSSGVKVTYYTLTATIAAAPCDAGSVTFTVSTNSTQPDVKWYKNGVLIAGATGLTYTTTTKGYYKATVTDLVKGCIKNTPSIQVSSLCRMGDFLQSEDVVAYPNPTKDYLTIDVNEEVEAFSISLYNMLGMKIRSEQFNNQFDMRTLPAGVYLMEIRDHSTNLIKRLRIEKQD
jgi:Secretion system C-terminal sorting domain